MNPLSATGTWGPCHHNGCGRGGVRYRDVHCQLSSGQPVMPDNCRALPRPPDTKSCTKRCWRGEIPSAGLDAQGKERSNLEQGQDGASKHSRGQVQSYRTAAQRFAGQRDGLANTGHGGSENPGERGLFEGGEGREGGDTAGSPGVRDEPDLGESSHDYERTGESRGGGDPKDGGSEQRDTRLDTSTHWDDVRSEAEWSTSPWSACKLNPEARTCTRSMGTRQRNVTCRLQSEPRVTVDPSLCTRVGLRPASSESCELACSAQDCAVTPFSSWSECDASCRATNRTRTRRIVVPPRLSGKECPSFSETELCDQCAVTFTYRVGDWGPCQLVSSEAYSGVTPQRTIGHQSRDLACIEADGRRVDLR